MLREAAEKAANHVKEHAQFDPTIIIVIIEAIMMILQNCRKDSDELQEAAQKRKQIAVLITSRQLRRAYKKKRRAKMNKHTARAIAADLVDQCCEASEDQMEQVYIDAATFVVKGKSEDEE